MQLSIDNPVTRLVAAATSVLETAGNKLLKKTADAVPENAEMTKLRQEQSAKIQLRLLVSTSNFTELIRFAEAAVDEDLIEVAIHEIHELKEKELSLQLLESLARGNSAAAIPALQGIVDKEDNDLARGILLERLQADHIPLLIAENKAKLSAVLSLIGQLTDDSNWSAYYFPLLWQCLSLDPKQQMSALCEILGDPEPGGCKYLYKSNHVHKCVKTESIRMLSSLPGPMRERAYWYATRDGDDEISALATRWLMHHWQTEGVVPQGLDFFPMADVRLLYYLVQLGANFRWQDGLPANDLYLEFVRGSNDLDGLEEGDPQHALLNEKVETLRHQLTQISERRIQELQPLVTQITTLLSLPYAQLNLIDRNDNSVASYIVGEGIVNLQRWILFEDEPMSEDVMSALLHELGHMGQDVLIIRMIADDLRLQYGRHADKIMPLWEKYAEGVGYAPSHMFLLAVLRLRADQHLTPAERQRAMHLFKDAKNAKLWTDYVRAINSRLDVLIGSAGQLLSGDYDFQLLSCLRDMKSVQTLFNSNCVPEVLVYELTKCREQLEDCVRLALANGHLGVGVKLRDYIALAEQLFGTEHGEPIRQVAERVRNVIYQTIDEEYRHLLRSRSQFMRAGYQEAECYIISDRVEVVVKAMRKGWY
jgi:hypothetical protein